MSDKDKDIEEYRISSCLVWADYLEKTQAVGPSVIKESAERIRYLATRLQEAEEEIEALNRMRAWYPLGEKLNCVSSSGESKTKATCDCGGIITIGDTMHCDTCGYSAAITINTQEREDG